MAVFRVNRNKNYTHMANYHFREKEMSLKAKGLLSLMLSLPEEWDYSVRGLAALSKDGKTRLYSPSSVTDASLETSISWEIPADCEKLWAVVACTPSEYFTHGWDENNANDIHWPYKVRFNGANI